LRRRRRQRGGADHTSGNLAGGKRPAVSEPTTILGLAVIAIFGLLNFSVIVITSAAI
jgi:hypothetical protein